MEIQDRRENGQFAPKGTGDRTGGTSDFERGLKAGFSSNKDRIEKLREELKTAKTFHDRIKLRALISILERGFNSEEEYEEWSRKKAEEYRARSKPIPTKKEDSSDYRMAHRPTESGITADDLTNQDVETPMPKDFYEKMENYTSEEVGTDESIRAIRAVRGKPDAKIKIYRATTGDSINDGDWVTFSKSYAQAHNAHSLENKGKILEMEVSVKDVQFAGDSVNEWGYFPKKRNAKQ